MGNAAFLRAENACAGRKKEATLHTIWRTITSAARFYVCENLVEFLTIRKWRGPFSDCVAHTIAPRVPVLRAHLLMIALFNAEPKRKRRHDTRHDDDKSPRK